MVWVQRPLVDPGDKVTEIHIRFGPHIEQTMFDAKYFQDKSWEQIKNDEKLKNVSTHC